MVPSDLKLAIYKGKGVKNDPGNYRPISVIPTLAKIIEKSVKAQLISYFVNNSVLSTCQTAYIKNHSTQTALHNLLDTCYRNINKGEINILTMLDLSKGFDVINRDILLYKLSKYGVSESSLNWFASYLSERYQYVCVNQNNSEMVPVKSGVPQGTVLGPILFLIYMNDFDTICDREFTTIYADDISTGCHSKTSFELELQMNKHLSNIGSWFQDNRLIISPNKSNFMLIGSRHAIDNTPDIKISLNGINIKRSHSSKLLGIYVDETLNFKENTHHLVSKISNKIGILHRLRQVLPQKALNQIYLTSIQPLFDYCITVWGPSSKTNVNTIQRLQNRCARAVTGDFSFETSVSYLIKSLGWMTIQERLHYFTSCLMYRCLNGISPRYLTDHFQYVYEYHKYNTRAATTCSDLQVPKSNAFIFKHSLHYHGSKTWNQLPLYIRQSNNLMSFKKALKNTYNETILD